MFAPSYFAPTYFPGGFFASVGGGPVPVDPNVYPSLPFTLGSTAQRNDGASVDYTEDGMPHKRARFSPLWYDITIYHTDLTAAEINLLEAFFHAHEMEWVTIPWPVRGRVFEALLLDYKEPGQRKAGNLFDATITARGRLL